MNKGKILAADGTLIPREVAKFCGRRIRAIREFRKMTQAAVARQLGVSQPAVARWEVGADVPHPHHVDGLAAVFCVELSWLLQRHDKRNEAELLDDARQFERQLQTFIAERQLEFEKKQAEAKLRAVTKAAASRQRKEDRRMKNAANLRALKKEQQAALEAKRRLDDMEFQKSPEFMEFKVEYLLRPIIPQHDD